MLIILGTIYFLIAFLVGRLGWRLEIKQMENPIITLVFVMLFWFQILLPAIMSKNVFGRIFSGKIV
jgi:hypothetical protein